MSNLRSSAEKPSALRHVRFREWFEGGVALVSEFLHKTHVRCVVTIGGQILHRTKEFRSLVIRRPLVGRFGPWRKQREPLVTVAMELATVLDKAGAAYIGFTAFNGQRVRES